MPRPFRFAAQVTKADPGRSWQDQARQIEDLGYSSLLVPDHLDQQLAPVPAMAVAAEATTSLRIGALVLANDFRHPVVLAKEMATLDVLSGGRVEVGIGAGWMQTDYQHSGIANDPAGLRVDRLSEAVDVIKGSFTGKPFSFRGDHYAVDELSGYPVPVQPGGPPILIGAGAKRMLGIAARRADIVSVNFDLAAGSWDRSALSTGTGDATRRKLSWLRRAAGQRFADLELSVTVFGARVTDDRLGAMERLAPRFGVDPAQGYDHPHLLVGSVDQICDTLRQRREEFGFSYIAIGGGAWEAMAPVVERLAGT